MPPVGLIDFSVGAGGGGAAWPAAVVVVVVGVVVSGAFSLLRAGGEHAHGDDRAHACGRDEATSHSA